MFWIKPKRSDGRAFAVREVNAIFLTKGVSMSSDAMALAVENSIPVLLLDGIGHPVAQIWSGQYGSISTIRKKQALFATDLQGMLWIREVLLQKMQQQSAQLASWRESRGAGWDESYRTSEQQRPDFDPDAPKPTGKRVGAICMDGVRQDKGGRGACGGHGGVRYWIYQVSEDSTALYPTENHWDHPEPLDNTDGLRHDSLYCQTLV